MVAFLLYLSKETANDDFLSKMFLAVPATIRG